ncbi:TetR-like C-terminal domain-containing protein [Streptomyces microflavus]
MASRRPPVCVRTWRRSAARRDGGVYAVCDGYLEFARCHPERYRTMFGGL